MFVTLSLELKLEGFDTPSDFTDADKAQICLNVLTLAGLENGRCKVLFLNPHIPTHCRKKFNQSLMI